MVWPCRGRDGLVSHLLLGLLLQHVWRLELDTHNKQSLEQKAQTGHDTKPVIIHVLIIHACVIVALFT